MWCTPWVEYIPQPTSLHLCVLRLRPRLWLWLIERSVSECSILRKRVRALRYIFISHPHTLHWNYVIKLADGYSPWSCIISLPPPRYTSNPVVHLNCIVRSLSSVSPLSSNYSSCSPPRLYPGHWSQLENTNWRDIHTDAVTLIAGVFTFCIRTVVSGAITVK